MRLEVDSRNCEDISMGVRCDPISNRESGPTFGQPSLFASALKNDTTITTLIRSSMLYFVRE